MKPDKRIMIAVARIVTREPFFASILLGKEVIEDPRVPTFCTNGLDIRYNPKFASTLTDDELIALLCHEVEHIARLHPWRRNGREMKQWNKATDFVINEELEKARFVLPKGALRDSTFDGLAEEQIYAKIAPPDAPGGDGPSGNGPGQGQPGPGQGQGQGKPGQGQAQGQGQPGNGGSGDGSQPGNEPGNFGAVEDCPGTEAEQNEALAQAKVEIIRAAQVAKSQGNLPASMASWVEEIKHPKVPWQEVLRDYLTAYARDDYSWTRPNKRYVDTGFSLPSLRNFRCGTIAIAIDTSGSIGQAEFAQFMGELRSIIESMKPERTILIQCDAAVQDYREVDAAELEGKIELCGGGGTSFIPVFERIEAEAEEPVCLVYLTDAYGDFPDNPPAYPVIWAITTDQKAPFGESIPVELNPNASK